MAEYNHSKIEKKWQKEWEKKGIFYAKDISKKQKYYSLIEFPYPSGDGLHVGHPRPYIGMDIISRKRRLEGFNVLYPIGWDAFGLPTENYAIKTGLDPRVVTKKNTDTFRRQIKSLGISFDWSREINTTDPKYYKWTQWIFLQFFKKGLAYKAKMTINWCPKDKTGLANEEVVAGCCERCGTPVEKREKEQWMLAITKYADRLDKDLDTVDYLPQIKLGQRNWIGRSEGAEIDFPVVDPKVKRFIILHGKHGSSKNLFVPWLKQSLEKKGYKVLSPDLPNSENPNDNEQADYLQNKITFDSSTIIIGHSMGGIVALRLLERGIKVHGTVLISTPITGKFLDGKIRTTVTEAINRGFDFNKIKKQSDYFRILTDSTDNIVSNNDGQILAKNLGAYNKNFSANSPHFTGNEEPAILDELLPSIKVFTTRLDTIFGATYVVLAPEHELVQKLKSQIKNFTEVEKYIKTVKSKTEIERTAEDKTKTGVELKGIKAVNPATKEEISIWIADYVLASYGTGAIMAVPAHDERDFEFAKKYNLEIKNVVIPIRIDEKNPHIPGKENVFRKIVMAVVKNPKNGKYLVLEVKNPKWTTFVIGGVEGEEDSETAARREILEESGYKNLKLIRVLGGPIHSEWYAGHKGVNRIANNTTIYFELENEEQEAIAPDEAAKHSVSWIDIKDITRDRMSHAELDIVLERLKTGNDVYTGSGKIINSGKFNGLDSEKVKKEIIKFVGGKEKTTFKLRDWIFSRQRYWGEPIPVIHCEKCGMVPVPEKDLPLILPKVKNYQPTDGGESPLANIAKWVNTICPTCGGKAKRETDTMPNWAGSSWYYLRYADPKNKKEFASKKNLKYWTPVDWYNGGNEHTTLHLLYSRFWHKFLFDLKLVPTSEPYKKRTSHGMILGEGGVKMSKSLGNVINPDDIVKTYGADTLRVYEMFMGPFNQSVAWSEEAIIGPRRFLERIWNLQYKIQKNKKYIEFEIEKTIKKVSSDIEEMKFNTAVSTLMIFVNEISKLEFISREVYEKFLKILSPFAPHLTDELWQILGHKKSINLESWPKYDLSKIQDEEIKIVVQINGKVRTEIMIKTEDSEEEIKKEVLKNEAVLKYITGKEVKKVFYIKNRLINIVV